MEVRIIDFPETKVAVIEHRGPPALKHESIKKLIAWRIENRLPPDRHRSYGIYYSDPWTVPPEEYRVDFCVSVAADVPPNGYGIIPKVIPACRCATVRHLGSREKITAATCLCEDWLPESGESPGGFPVFIHYVNVGPDIREDQMISDVYLPLAPAGHGK